MIRYTKDTDLIATLTLDMQRRSTNILNHKIVDAFVPVIEHLKSEKEKGQLRGVIITSAKKTFLAGGDLEYLYRAEDPQEIFSYSQKLKSFFRDIERPGVPVAAAINGNALSTGFELALACHYRIVLDKPGIQLGFPEIHYGLMPGNGGVIRLMWLLGIEKAFDILLRGERFTPKSALAAGLIDDLAGSDTELLSKAKNWLLAQPSSRMAWDVEKARIPGGTARDPHLARRIAQLSASVAARWKNNFPAPQLILNTLAEGSKVDFDTANRIESRYYTTLLTSRECKNMIKAKWFDLRVIHEGISRPKGFGRFRPKRVGVVGAGQMGSAIAAACLSKGMKVVLKDVSRMIAEQGRERTQKMLAELQEGGELKEAVIRKAMANLTTTEHASDFADCDLVIESVFENQHVKSKVTRDAEQYLDEYAILASNTVSIPIARLAEFSDRPQQFIGLHFFKPAEKSPLVEVVKGKKTSEETIARAFDFVRALGKTPVIVKDDWGFYVARVHNTYILEGVTLLQEGVPPAVIENLGRKAGMPYGPFEVADELSLELVLRYEQQAAGHYGNRYLQHPATAILQQMLDEEKRPGKQWGKGFYDWKAQPPQLWAGLSVWGTAKPDFDAQEIMERMLFAQVIEAVWCLQEGVINTVEEANIGSIFGWGFPAFKGGVLQYVNSYGREAFQEKCNQLQKVLGQRFKVPKWLNKNL